MSIIFVRGGVWGMSLHNPGDEDYDSAACASLEGGAPLAVTAYSG